MNLIENKITTEIAGLLKMATKVTLSQSRTVDKILKRYLPYVKNENHVYYVVDLVKKFLEVTENKEASFIRDTFRSIVTYDKHYGKDSQFTIRKKNNKNGACKIDKEVWGRPRTIETSEWINKINGEIKKAK